MGEYQRGDIVLVRFPFTDLRTTKLRPAVIVAVHGEDVIVVGVFATVPLTVPATWLRLDDSHPHFPQTGLKRSSVVKAEKLAILHRAIVDSRIGSLHPSLMSALNGLIKQALHLP